MPAAVLTYGLTKRYGRRTGIESLDLEVRPGEVFGFIGPNGAGKTTTIRLLLDLLHPTSGKAQVLGHDTRTHSVLIRHKTGYLPGEFGLDPRVTARRLVTHFARLRGLTDLKYAFTLAQRLELDLDLPCGRQSRGNRQKVGLLLALFHRPELAVLDEPTTGLDPLMQETFLQIVREAQQEGRTVFLSSHILSEVERVCERVAIVKQGRLVAVETMQSLRERRRRRVMVTFAEPIDPTPFAMLPTVSDVRYEGSTLWLRVGDGIDAVVKLAAQHTVNELVVEQPSLDEVFMTYYPAQA